MERPQSPCIRVCVLDPVTDQCSGCGRRRMEIAAWSRMDDAQRGDVLAELPDRLRAMTRRDVRGRRAVPRAP
ncbi:MAG: DUF1289 domain-containing protein [Alphaproteobacteria bacterium]